MTADLLLLAFLFAGFFIGWRKGTINVLGGIGAFILAYVAARNFSASIALAITERFPGLLTPSTDGSEGKNLLSVFLDMEVVANRLIQILAFIIIFVVVVFVVKKLARLLSNALRKTLIGKLNSAIGAFLGVLITIFLMAIVIDMVLPIFDKTSWGEAALTFLAGSKFMLPLIYSFVGVLIANLPKIAELYKK
ncbi:MAG: CvpA family protein [Clostridiales bacterium]|nr:CvpA family protein [Clostridiales bacterium]